MRKTVLLLLALVIATTAAAQQPVHKSTLNWIASPDAATNPTLFYNVYRALGPCPATGSPTTLANIGSTLAGALSYVDVGVNVAQSYCYIVRSAVKDGSGNLVESADSVSAQAVIPLARPSGLTAAGS
jgi:hypothetical protein